MLDFVGKRYWYFALSLLVIVPGVVSILIPPAFKPGIEFTSGSTMTVTFNPDVEQSAVRNTLERLGFGDAIIQRTGEGDFIIRTKPLQNEVRDQAGNVVTPGEKDRILEELGKLIPNGSAQLLSFDSVSPIIAEETVRNSGLAVLAASVGILLYITWAFRSVPNPFRYGLCAIIALIHDVLVVLGLFSIFGKLFGIEVDSLFITALLTVIGFSVHDTIVVFDRIRENLKRGVHDNLADAVNDSILQTIGRSINTTLTVVLTLLALYLFGGITIRNFVLVLLIGIISGTYSSIFNASQLLVAWEQRDLSRFWRRLRSGQGFTAARV